jgi:WD40 repeat protein
MAAINKPVVLRDPECLRGIQSAAWSPAGSRLALIDGDAQIRVWDADKDIFSSRVRASDLPAGFRGNMGENYSLTWSPEAKHLTLVGGGQIQVVDPASGKISKRFLAMRGLEFLGNRYIWSPNGKLLASAPTSNQDVIIWDAIQGKELFPIPTSRLADPVPQETGCTPAWDPSGRRLALGGNDGMVRVSVVGARRAVRSPVRSGIAWSANGQSILCVPNRTGMLGGPELNRPESTFQVRDAITGNFH